jgi:hypothetical protein
MKAEREQTGAERAVMAVSVLIYARRIEFKSTKQWLHQKMTTGRNKITAWTVLGGVFLFLLMDEVVQEE